MSFFVSKLHIYTHIFCFYMHCTLRFLFLCHVLYNLLIFLDNDHKGVFADNKPRWALVLKQNFGMSINFLVRFQFCCFDYRRSIVYVLFLESRCQVYTEGRLQCIVNTTVLDKIIIYLASYNNVF